MDTVQSQHCTACGIERRVVYSEPIARGYELRFLQCSNCNTVCQRVASSVEPVGSAGAGSPNRGAGHYLAWCSPLFQEAFQVGNFRIPCAASCCDRGGIRRNPNSQRVRLLDFGSRLSRHNLRHRALRIEDRSSGGRSTQGIPGSHRNNLRLRAWALLSQVVLSRLPSGGYHAPQKTKMDARRSWCSPDSGRQFQCCDFDLRYHPELVFCFIEIVVTFPPSLARDGMNDEPLVFRGNEIGLGGL